MTDNLKHLRVGKRSRPAERPEAPAGDGGTCRPGRKTLALALALTLTMLFSADPSFAAAGEDSEYKALEAWFNGSNISAHPEDSYWRDSEYRPDVRGRFRLENRQLLLENEAGTGAWKIEGRTYAGIGRDMLTILDAFRQYALQHRAFINITGASGRDRDTVWISLSEKDGPGAPVLCSFVLCDFKAPRAAAQSGEAAGISGAALIYEMGMNYRTEQLMDLLAQGGWRDTFLRCGRILDGDLAKMNRELLTRLFGMEAGREAFEFAIGKYSALYMKDAAGPWLALCDLPNETRDFGKFRMLFDDDDTSRATFYINGIWGER